MSHQKFSDARPCSGGYANWGSLACKKFPAGPAPRQSGFQVSWNSNALNITNDAALSGNFIAQAAWFFDLCVLEDCLRWLEIGDTAGTGMIQGREDFWERWYYWVDGTNYPTTYIEHGIAPSPNDGLQRTYFIQWEASESLWALYLCSPTCIRQGSAPWIPPTSMGVQFQETGLEVSVHVNNLNSNSAVIQDKFIQSRNAGSLVYSGWTSSNVNVEITAGCGFGYPTSYCLNGTWDVPPPPYDKWNNNKP